MTFEEEKPSKEMIREADVLDKGDMVQVLSAGYPTKGRKDFYDANIVRKNFILKEKVKEVTDTGNNPVCSKCADYIKRKLGLE